MRTKQWLKKYSYCVSNKKKMKKVMTISISLYIFLFVISKKLVKMYNEVLRKKGYKK